MVPFQIGLLAPEVEIDYHEISHKYMDSFVDPIDKIHNIGSKLGSENPIAAKVLFYFLANMIWVYYFAVAILIFNLVRFSVSWIVLKVRKSSGGSK